VRILGKGNKLRMCPLWPRTSSLLLAMIRGRGRNEPVLLGCTSQLMTRFGVHRLVTHYAKLVARSSPSLIGKRVSCHYVSFLTMSGNSEAPADLIGNVGSSRARVLPITQHSFARIQESNLRVS
jgi:integrase/recombinase XerD